MPTNVNGVTILDAPASLEGAATIPTASDNVVLVRLGDFTGTGATAAGRAEALAYDATTAQIAVTNAAADRIDLIRINADGTTTAASSIDLATLGNYGEVNSVAVANGVLAVAYQNATNGQPGAVALFDLATGALVNTVTVGVLPDQLVFTPDGLRLLVANEAEAVSASSNAPGTISIISLVGGAALAAVTNTISFAALNGAEAQLRTLGLPIFPGQAAANDIEPEYITVSPDGTRAYVTLQEVNGVAVIDLTNPLASAPMSIQPLGFIDRSLPGNAFDPNDQNGVSIGNFPILSLPQPDAIASFAVGGVTYFITANEGDARVGGNTLLDEARLSSSGYVLDPTTFPDAADIKAQAGRLNVITSTGDTDGDGDFDQIVTFGGRGVSIFRQNGDGSFTKVRETGGEFERIIANALPQLHNTENLASPDNRSDNKGPEPEGVDTAVIDGRTYAFVALERVGGVITYDVTDPANAQFVGYRPTTSRDFAPETIKAIAAADNPTGRPLVITANEGSGTVTLYAVASQSAGNDTIAGGELDEGFEGRDGNDSITGGGGNDTLFGGAGNDTIAGGTGDDTIDGGAGDDRVSTNLSTDGADRIDLGTAGSGADVLTVNAAAAGQVRLTFTSAEVGNGNVNDSGAQTNQDGGLAVRLQLEDANGAPTGPVTRVDDEGTVFVSGTAGLTFDVRDLVSGVARGDQFEVAILGTSFGDGLTAAQPARPYYFNAGQGNDQIEGGTSNDFLVGGAGDDRLFGDLGNDSFIGGGGNDLIQAGPGGDRAIFNISTDGVDQIDLGDGGATPDVVAVSGAAAGQVRLTFTSAEIGNGQVNDAGTLANQDGGLAVRMQLEGAGDTLTGGVTRVEDEGLLFTSATAGLTFDVRDLVSGVARGDQFEVVWLGSQLSDGLVAAETGRSYYFNGGQGNDQIEGGAVSDFLVGGAGDDRLFGGLGDDSFIGGGGNDLIQAGPGADIVIHNITTDGADQIDLGDGAAAPDVVRVSAAAAGQVRLTFTSAEVGNGQVNDGATGTNQDGGLAVRMQSEGPADVLTGPITRVEDEGVLFASTTAGLTFDVRDLTSGAARGDQFEFVWLGSTLGDALTSREAGRSYYINGGGGADALTGESVNDFLVGGGGDDALLGLAGADTLFGGGGNDLLIGGAGGDQLFGMAGADEFRFLLADADSTAAATDFVTDFETGVDRLNLFSTGEAVTSINRIGTGTLVFSSFGQTTQTLVGVTGAVQGRDVQVSGRLDFVGTDSAEQLLGRDGGVNRIFGGGGTDEIFGGSGADTIYGDLGRDRMTGGAGADVFAFRNRGDSAVGTPDIITDFVSGTDKIDLTLVRTGAADRFGFAVKDGDTFIFVDLGGDGTNDMEIALQGVTNLQLTDFVF